MTGDRKYRADVIVAGGGIAGIVTALELLDHGKCVVLFERDQEEKFGGQAITAFGGMALAGTPLQRRLRIKDSPGAWLEKSITVVVPPNAAANVPV